MSKNRKQYTKAEKLEIIKESLEPDVRSTELALRYSLHTNTINRWRREFLALRDAAFPGNGNAILTDEQREMRNLRKELRESELANEILKKALGIISSPNRKNLFS